MSSPDAKSRIENVAISLTTDEKSDGHGLPDGRQITDDQAKQLRFYSESKGNKFSVDHTKYRIKIEIPRADPFLISAYDFYQNNPIVLKALEVSGYCPTSVDSKDEEITQAIIGIKNGSLMGKGETWWFYKNELTINKIIGVSVKFPDGIYSKVILLKEIEANLEELKGEKNRS